MAYCRKCGKPVNESDAFCASCGEKQDDAAANSGETFKDFAGKMGDMSAGADVTENFEENDIKENKVLAVFAYLGILVLVPIFGASKSKFAQFHANQGLVLFIAEIIFFIAKAIVSTILKLILGFVGSLISWLLSLVGIVFIVYIILGIINTINGKAKELPLIGGIKILKTE